MGKKKTDKPEAAPAKKAPEIEPDPDYVLSDNPSERAVAALCNRFGWGKAVASSYLEGASEANVEALAGAKSSHEVSAAVAAIAADKDNA